MARKLDAGEFGRTEIYLIAPENLICNQTENSRSIPHSAEEIESLAKSILEHGQLQPVVARLVEGKKVQVIAGYGRVTAIRYINEHLNPDTPLRVRVQVLEMNAEEAFVRSIAENIDRAETTPIDDAHAQRKLREQFGWTDARIAEFYKKSVTYIGQLRKTLQLSQNLKEEVANGNLPVSTAITLTELPEQEREEVVKEAKGSDGKVKSEKVKQAVRKKKQAQGKSVERSLKEVKDFFGLYTDSEEDEDIREFCNSVLAFIGGGSEEDMVDAMSFWINKRADKGRDI